MISIIIPVFNVENFLHRCLNSVRSQTFTDFECILVDDASSDNSPAVCDEYASNDNRFKVIHKSQNEGVSKARNTGLDNAIACFVMFVDSDDWLEQNALQFLFEKQKEGDADIVRANLRYHYYTYSENSIVDFPSDNKEDPLLYFFVLGYTTLCATLYKKSLFSGYIVPEIHIGEDAIINVQIFSRISPDKICYTNDIIYNYDRRTNGVTIEVEQNAYLSFEDYPVYKSMLFIGNYLHESGKDTENVMSAFTAYFIYNVILPYIINKKRLSRNEINIIYRNYWERCNHKYLFKGWRRKIIPVFHLSVKLGELYIYLIMVNDTLNGVYTRFKCDGVVNASKYYYHKLFKNP